MNFIVGQVIFNFKSKNRVENRHGQDIILQSFIKYRIVSDTIRVKSHAIQHY